MLRMEVAFVWWCWDASHLHFLPDMFCIAHWQAFMTSKLSLLWMHFLQSTRTHTFVFKFQNTQDTSLSSSTLSNLHGSCIRLFEGIDMDTALESQASPSKSLSANRRTILMWTMWTLVARSSSWNGTRPTENMFPSWRPSSSWPFALLFTALQFHLIYTTGHYKICQFSNIHVNGWNCAQPPKAQGSLSTTKDGCRTFGYTVYCLYL